MTESTPLLLCLGAGGVGKTTSAAALTVSAARSGKRAMVLTIDPARRLAEALGLTGEIGNTPIKIAGDWERGGGEFWATMLDSPTILSDLITELSASAEQAEAINANRIFANLTDSLSGTHEYMAGERVRQICTSGDVDVLVVDTPPAHHAIDFLDAPARLTRFFDHRLYRSFVAPKHGLMKAVNAAAHLVLRTVSKVVGAELLRDVTELFEMLEGVDTAFRNRAEEVADLLVSGQARFVLVTGPKPEPLRTAAWMVGELKERGLSVDLMIANRMTPTFGPPTSTSTENESGPLAKNLEQLNQLVESEAKLVKSLSDTSGSPVIRIDELTVPAVGLDDLGTLAEQLSPFWEE